MGVVYKAQDLKLDRPVALKFLPQRFLTVPEEVARFEQEAKAISALADTHCTLPSVFTISWPVAVSVPAPWLQA